MTDLISRSSDRRVSEDCRVELHFSLSLENGEEIDTTRRGNPATFEFGDGSLLPGFEAALVGLRAGDDVRIVLEPDAAFGHTREENVQSIERQRFAGLSLEPGLLVSFAGPGGELPGVVRIVGDDKVEVDFNHPLAGRRIVFEVTILEISDALAAGTAADERDADATSGTS
jgi:FKBP-type peptidyl-prolyl cis-trans isomerase SlpA